MIFMTSDRSDILIAFACTVGLALASSVQAQGEFDTIAVTGEQAPGLSSGNNFDRLNLMTLNNQNQAIFRASTSMGDQGLWASSASGEDVFRVVSTGEPMPGTANGTFVDSTSQPLRLSNSGDMAHLLGIEGAGVNDDNDTGIWNVNAGDGSLTLIAREGSAAPGTNGQYEALDRAPVVNDAGQVTYTANVTTLGQNPPVGGHEGIWTGSASGGTPQLVVKRTDAAPGIGGDATFDAFNRGIRNQAGQIGFQGQLTGTGLDPEDDQGIWVAPAGGGDKELVVRTGEDAAGVTGDAIYDSIGMRQFNEAGGVGFAADLTGTDITGDNDQGVWLGATPSDAPQLLWREGDPAPGLEADTLISAVGNQEWSPSGHVTLKTSLKGPSVTNANDQAIWLGSENGLELIGREGDEFGEGFRVGRFMLINRNGQIAFVGSDSTDTETLWATLTDGTLVDLVSTGEMIEVRDDMKTVDDLNLSFATRGGFESLSDDGRLGFEVSFEDGTQALLTTTIPEPGTALGLGLFSLVALRRRRRAH